MRSKLLAILIFTIGFAILGPIHGIQANEAQTAFFVTHGWTFDDATEGEIARLSNGAASGMLGIVDYPVWGPFSLGVMSSVWHHSGSSPSASEQFELSALLSGGPSVRISPNSSSDWSLFAAVHQGIFIHYSQKENTPQGSARQIAVSRDFSHLSSHGFSVGLTLPTARIAGLEIGAAAVYERMQFPKATRLEPTSYSETSQGFSLNRLSLGIDFLVRF